VIAAAVAALFALAGRGGAIAAAALSQASAPRPAACPPHPPSSLPAQRWRAAEGQLAPAGAVAIRLCRYSGLNAHPKSALVSSRLLADPAVVRGIVTGFDRLPQMPRGIFCPMDDGSQILVFLAYRGGRELTIRVALTGCRIVTNGSVGRTAAGFGAAPAAGPQLIKQLEQLL